MQGLASKRMLGAFQQFFQTAASGGIVLLLATVLAFALANSPWAQAYFDVWHLPVRLAFGGFELSKDLHFLINEGLMALFFFVVGLEIKRELLVGELASPRQAIYALFAAIGGMLVPALLYLLLNPPGSPYFAGWGIPSVTDIAFSVGILSLLGTRVPLYLKVFLISLAIIDDLGAILIIAFFYSGGVELPTLIQATLLFGLLALMSRLGIYHPLLYLVVGMMLWYSLLLSGIHATLAGVLVALTIPAHPRLPLGRVYEEGLSTLEHYRHRLNMPPDELLRERESLEGLLYLKTLSRQALPPLQQLEHALQPWVTFAIIPLFALANAGVAVSFAGFGQALSSSVLHGIVLGLVIGKPLGITLFTWLAVRLRLIALPPEIRWGQIYGIGQLAGIGFTMSLFIAALAMDRSQELMTAKIAIILASLLSSSLGWILLTRQLPGQPPVTEQTPAAIP